MKAKTIVTGILLLFVGVSVVYLIAKEARNHASPPERANNRVDPPESARGTGESEIYTEEEPEDKVIVYYFHGTNRCHTCRTIEAYAEEAVRANFSKELVSGKLEWHAVNVEEPDNEHFVRDFQLASRCVVLVEMEKGVPKKWKSLEKVWQLVRFKPEFVEYIVDNTKSFVAGKNG